MNDEIMIATVTGKTLGCSPVLDPKHGPPYVQVTAGGPSGADPPGMGVCFSVWLTYEQALRLAQALVGASERVRAAHATYQASQKGLFPEEET